MQACYFLVQTMTALILHDLSDSYHKYSQKICRGSYASILSAHFHFIGRSHDLKHFLILSEQGSDMTDHQVKQEQQVSNDGPSLFFRIQIPKVGAT